MSRLDELIEKLCPNGVEWKKLGDIGKVSMCKRILKHQTGAEGDVPFFKIGSFGKEPDAYISKKLFEEYRQKYSYPKKGDILISASGTIGRTVVFDGSPAYFQDSNIVWIDNDEKIILNKFLYYLYQKINWNLPKGGTISRLYNDNINKTIVPTPPLEIQEEIVHILDSFTKVTSEITEKLEAEFTARRKQYEFYRDSLLTFGDDVPRVILDDVATVTKLAGFEFTKYVNYSNEGEIIALRGLNIKNGKLDLKDVKYIDSSDLSKLTRSKLHVGDMLFTYVGTIGQVALVDSEDKYYLAPNVAMIRSTVSTLLPEYMKYYFQSEYFWNTQINKLIQSSSMKNIPMEKIRKFQIALPSIEVQERIVSILDKFDKLCNDISEGLPAEIEARKKQYEYYRDKLLNFEELKKS